jgi:Rrf2 family protein
MLITRQTDYAIRCALFLGRARSAPVAATTIAREMHVPRAFVSKVLQRLAAAGIVESARGARGGFSLARDPASVTLLDVVRAVQGDPAINLCVIDGRRCSRDRGCAVHPVFVRLRELVERHLGREDLATLAASTAAAPAPPTARRGSGRRSKQSSREPR